MTTYRSPRVWLVTLAALAGIAGSSRSPGRPPRPAPSPAGSGPRPTPRRTDRLFPQGHRRTGRRDLGEADRHVRQRGGAPDRRQARPREQGVGLAGDEGRDRGARGHGARIGPGRPSRAGREVQERGRPGRAARPPHDEDQGGRPDHDRQRRLVEGERRGREAGWSGPGFDDQGLVQGRRRGESRRGRLGLGERGALAAAEQSGEPQAPAARGLQGRRRASRSSGSTPCRRTSRGRGST